VIKPGEIDKIAIKKGVRATQIQKDYAISWIIWGISQNIFLKKNLVFKGGTCLKKVHFDDYRYSEDMDFTLVNDGVDNDEVMKNFDSLFKEVFNASRIKPGVEDNSFDIHESSGSIKFKIEFKGPHGSDTIKVDITRGEKILFDVKERTIFNIYSDLEQEDEIRINAYSLKEVLIEKITALMGRTISRDLYDFNYLTEEEGMKLEDVYIEFMTKAENKGHNPKEFIDKVKPKEDIFKRDWEESLIKQIKKGDLPDFKEVWRKANRKFRKLIELLEN
jgi:predicted nucleotidyltransferase component of viral defense system